MFAIEKLEEEMDTTQYLLSNPTNKKILQKSMKQVEDEDYITFKNVDELEKYVGSITQ